MPVQWFPGHMNSTKKAIIERVKGIDVVIEMLDARLPGSSGNPLLADLTRGKPALKVLNKQDLADAQRTAQWLLHFNAQPATQAVALDGRAGAPVHRIVEACRELAPLRGGMVKPLRVLICGIPNVGKSTVINTLAGRVAAKTGDEPGITKLEQKIVLANDFYLFDTPGMLWPRIVVEQSGYHLAASGAVGRNAFDDEEVALILLANLHRDYPGQIEQRYRLDATVVRTDDERLAAIGRQRGAALPGGRISLQKAAEIVLHDFRSGSLGRITLETPDDWIRWQAEAVVKEAERQAEREARAKSKHTSRSQPTEG
ncbi:MAG: ribosome biogenesis GTPase YlqF [Pseudomonadota bacterium]|nr:ribosome biogenesis GTPase YlqF [Pseudomonadota bacterium]